MQPFEFLDFEELEMNEEDQWNKPKRGRKPIVLKNPLSLYFESHSPPDWIDDIVSGVIASYYENKTNKNHQSFVDKNKLLKLLSNMETFSTDSISLALNIKQRTAQKYLQVLKTTIPFLIRAMQQGNTNKAQYIFIRHIKYLQAA